MANPSPSNGPAPGGDNCPLLAASARFLIWTTRNARASEPEAAARPAAGNPVDPAKCS
jgi:hypothetical protein